MRSSSASLRGRLKRAMNQGVASVAVICGGRCRPAAESPFLNLFFPSCYREKSAAGGRGTEEQRFQSLTAFPLGAGEDAFRNSALEEGRKKRDKVVKRLERGPRGLLDPQTPGG